jgi:membrane-associated phospholipid phosphatase
MICALSLLYARRRDVYRWFRNVLFLTTGLALVGHIAYPLSPPRLEPDFGMVDTGVEFGQTAYGARPGTGFTNQFAAMPSMHVAWAALIAVAVIVCLRTAWRWLAPLYAVGILIVVVVTGNHYWLDGIVGLALLAISMLVFRPPQVGEAPA